MVGAAVLAGVAACLGISWWLNEYRYSVNSGSLFFLGHTVWQPPLGWAPWIACGVLGLLALLVAGIGGWSRSTRSLKRSV